uniref:Uncharacterized protein n=1 Tax=Knipowitschia caucasica TaxID=637954 RepID=A0AAV2K5A2_KNICA
MTHTEVPKMARVVIRRRRRRQCCFIVLIKSSVGGARWLKLRSCEDVYRRAMVGDVETVEGDDSPCQVSRKASNRGHIAESSLRDSRGR